MHAFLVSSPPDKYPASPDVLNIYPENSIGIAEIRNIISFLSRKPHSSPQNVVIINQAEKLTLDAQHALLKTLEEPPGNSLIYLVTTQPDSLLPTILSRCTVIKDLYPSEARQSEEGPNLSEFWTKFLSAGVGERLGMLDEQEFTRDSALEFLNNLEHLLHQQIISPSPEVRRGVRGEVFHLVSSARHYLKSNVNVHLAMDSLAIASQ